MIPVISAGSETRFSGHDQPLGLLKLMSWPLPAHHWLSSQLLGNLPRALEVICLSAWQQCLIITSLLTSNGNERNFRRKIISLIMQRNITKYATHQTMVMFLTNLIKAGARVGLLCGVQTLSENTLPPDFTFTIYLAFSFVAWDLEATSDSRWAMIMNH